MSRHILDREVAARRFHRSIVTSVDAMSPYSLEVVLERQRLSPVAVWDHLYSSHRDFLTERVAELDGRKCQAQDVAKRIEQSGRVHFEVSWANSLITYGHVANSDLSLVNIDHAVTDVAPAE